MTDQIQYSNNPDAIRQYLEKAVPAFQDQLKLATWDIRWKVEAVDGSAESRCRVNPTYYTLDVSFDPTKIRDRAHLKETLIHELLHAVIGQYEITSDRVADQLSPQARDGMQQVLCTELERTVTHLERIVASLIKDPALEEGL